MAKHKEITMWVAVLDQGWGSDTPTVRTAKVRVVETDKQYRLVKDGSKEFRLALQACGYRTHINKSSDCKLFPTEAVALRDLQSRVDRYTRVQMSKAARAARDAELVKRYIEDAKSDD